MIPPEVPPTTMTKRIKRIAPLQAGKILGILYGAMGLLFLPFILIATLAGGQLPAEERVGMMAVGVGFAIFAPVIYGVMGFIFGALCAWFYNVIAKWIGGFEIELE